MCWDGVRDLTSNRFLSILLWQDDSNFHQKHYFPVTSLERQGQVMGWNKKVCRVRAFYKCSLHLLSPPLSSKPKSPTQCSLFKISSRIFEVQRERFIHLFICLLKNRPKSSQHCHILSYSAFTFCPCNKMKQENRWSFPGCTEDTIFCLLRKIYGSVSYQWIYWKAMMYSSTLCEIFKKIIPTLPYGAIAIC